MPEAVFLEEGEEVGYEFLRHEREDGLGIARLTINRPKVLNALDSHTLNELRDFFTYRLPDEGLTALILTGAGEKAFVAGADIA